MEETLEWLGRPIEQPVEDKPKVDSNGRKLIPAGLEQLPIDHEPTLDDMAKLTIDEYHEYNGFLYVRAAKKWRIPRQHTWQLHYHCPYCPRRSKKNPAVHTHGAKDEEAYENPQWEERVTHCPTRQNSSGEVRIAVIGFKPKPKISKKK
jgi:hypothetical protein